jgi:hypothetical protein
VHTHRPRSLATWAAAISLAAACGGIRPGVNAPSAPALPAPSAQPTSAEEPGTPFRHEPNAANDDTANAPIALPAAPPGLPPAPASCAAYVEQSTAGHGCGDAAAARAALADALADDDDARDAALALLEGCGFHPGLVRALRIELAPPECGDALAAPVLAGPTPLDRAEHDALVGLAIVARLQRIPMNAPIFRDCDEPRTKAEKLRYFSDELDPWTRGCP